MPLSFSAGVRDSLSNLAASLGVGRDKAAHDAFGLFTLERAQIEAMYRGDWLARKVVDIVPYDSIRAWRAWSGLRSDVDRMEAAERRLGLRKTIQRAMVLGRLYGGGAILIGTGESDPAALARPLDERLPRGGLKFLHVVSRWQLGVAALDADPLSPWCGEPALYELSAPGRPALALHPSRVVRFLGHPLPDPTLAPTFWSDSVLQVLYDAVHAVALTTVGATSLMHEAKVDIVTVPNLSEHLSSTETTQQLSARFAYAAAMKSINNLLLLGDGESWSRQSVDFAGLPEMVRTFLQVAAGAADIPVTRLLGQSPAGLSATGDSDTRNYYDMIAARQELDLRPQLERLDRLIAHSEGIDPGALTFAFRPLWQLDAPSQAALALQKAQATQVYAGLKLWPAEETARLVEAQLVADGTYPNAAAVFGEGGVKQVADRRAAVDFDPDQPRDWHGRWTTGATANSHLPSESTKAVETAGAAGKAEYSTSKTASKMNGALSSRSDLNPAGTMQAQQFGPDHEDRGVVRAVGRELGQSPDRVLLEFVAATSGEKDQQSSLPQTRTHIDPFTRKVIQQAINTLSPLLTIEKFRQSTRGKIAGLTNQLLNWSAGAPPDPSQAGKPDGTSTAGEQIRRPSAGQTAQSLDPIIEGMLREEIAILAVHEVFRQRLREVVSGLANHLPSWPTGTPPSPPSEGKLAGSGMAEPVQSPVPRTWPVPTAGKASPSFNEQSQDPASPGGGDSSKPVDAIEVPPGSIAKIKPGTSSEQGNFFAEEVRRILRFSTAPTDLTSGGKMPDGLLRDPSSGLQIAMEAKYLSRVQGGLRDPYRTLEFVNSDDIAQARKYNDYYKGGLLWVVNDERLIPKFKKMFEEEKIFGVRIVCIPSVQE